MWRTTNSNKHIIKRQDNKDQDKNRVIDHSAYKHSFARQVFTQICMICFILCLARWMPSLSQFLFEYDVKYIVSEETCLKSKNKDKPSCIDVFITNSSFQNTSTITTGISDFHKMVITVLKATFTKSKPLLIENLNRLTKKNLKLILKIL